MGEAVAKFVKKNSTEKMPIIIGRDTRKSGESLLKSFSQGLNNQGLFAVSAGIVPTPVLAHGVIANQCHLGVMITASHNPQADNGFKFFSQNGTKLSEKQESIIENNIHHKKHCVTVGLSFENHTTSKWNIQKHDIKLDYVVSSMKIYEF